MPRPKGRKKNTAALTEKEANKILADFKKYSEELDWDELLSETGKNIEDIGRMLRGKRRQKPRVWTIEELQDLRSALLSHRRIIQCYVDHLREDSQGKHGL